MTSLKLSSTLEVNDAKNSSDDMSPKPENDDLSRSHYDETLLTNSFDNQLRLVGNSIQENSIDVDDKLKISKRTKKKKKPTTEKVESDKIIKPILSHRSKIYRYEDESIETPTNEKPKNCDEPINSANRNRSVTNDISMGSINPDDCPLVPPPPFNLSSLPEDGSQAHASMMMSWYMAGYHTGYYAAMRKFKLCD